MIYITGDKHGDFSEVYAFCCKIKQQEMIL